MFPQGDRPLTVHFTHDEPYLYLRGRQPWLSSTEFSSMHNHNMTKGQDVFLVALMNRTRVVKLTLPNSSGSMKCAPNMECSLEGDKMFPPLHHMLGIVDLFGSS